MGMFSMVLVLHADPRHTERLFLESSLLTVASLGFFSKSRVLGNTLDGWSFRSAAPEENGFP